MKDSLHTIVFSIVLGCICSLMLSATSRFTTPFREANAKAEQVRNFLSALDVPIGPQADAAALLEVFDKNVRKKELAGLDLYEYVPETSGSGTPIAVAAPFAGPGLWGPIKGVMALEPDLLTVRGVRFYQQEETPGLGGEIGAEWFQKQFAGKTLVSKDGAPGFVIQKSGAAADRNSVDGITGATMTCDRVQDLLDNVAKKLAEARKAHVPER